MILCTETLHGVGAVSIDGTLFARVAYQLEIVEDSSGVQQFVGRIDILGAWTLICILLATTTPLTLREASGRCIDFLVTAEGEATGSAYIRGWLSREDISQVSE